MSRMPQSKNLSTFFALLAAVLFGISAPLAKLLLGEIQPVMLAAFLYLGSGLGLSLAGGVLRKFRGPGAGEARLARGDLVWMAGATLAGGVIGPVILMLGLRGTPAATASLLLNFESVATTVIAAFFFKEMVSGRAWFAIILITGAGILLSISPDAAWGFSLGAAGILAASLMWGLDNNLTRNISAKDPVAIVTIKGLAAGSFSLLLALSVGESLPDWEAVLKACLLGSVSYGLSIILYVRALRGLGAARTSGLYSTAPLSGLVLSILLFRESPNWLLFLALPLMSAGTYLLVNERHDHLHAHPAWLHDHAHHHMDGHHDHPHAGEVNPDQIHAHMHEHQEIDHQHHHMPDTHHRHVHES